MRQNDVGKAAKGSPYSQSTLSDAPPYTVMLRSLSTTIYSNRGARVSHRAIRQPLDRVAYDVASLVFDRELVWVCSA